MIQTMKIASPVGEILLAAEDEKLTGLWIKGQTPDLDPLKEEIREEETPVLLQTAAWLERYFCGEQPGIQEIALAPSGTKFRQEVWKILCTIPYGKTMSYGEIARRIEETHENLSKTEEMPGFSEKTEGMSENLLKAEKTSGFPKMSAQAVGGAVGRNPISIIIPCHRVIGSDGSLTGYAGGLHLKEMLLIHEGIKIKDGHCLVN